LAGFVVVVGWLLPKRHVASRSAWYHATAEQLFALITGAQTWRSDVLRCESVQDAGGRQLLRETSRSGEDITYEVLDRNPPWSITRRIVTKGLPYSGTWRYSIKAEAGVTILRITEDGEVYNPVFRFMSRFVLGHTASIDAYLRALGKATGQDIEVKEIR
jgi:hypothetical protein